VGRLQPYRYLTYGNISMRMIYHNQHYENSKNKRAILNFVSRLHWHYFIQKFEDECRMEFENVNRAMMWLKPKTKATSKLGKKEKRVFPL
jgi:deoxyribodipyrimidine photo-lyase